MHRSQSLGKKYINDEGYHCKKFSTSRSIQPLASQGLVYCSNILAFGQDKDPLPYPASEIVVLATPGRNIHSLAFQRLRQLGDFRDKTCTVQYHISQVDK